MRYILFLLACVCSASTVAETVSTIRLFEVPAALRNQADENVARARAIHEEMGAEVYVGRDERGRIHYVMSFDDAVARGRFQDQLPKNEKWIAFMEEISKQDANATLKSILHTRNVIDADGEDGNAAVVYQWRVDRPQVDRWVELSRRARKIQEKLGATVIMGMSDKGIANYILTFPNWEAEGKFDERSRTSEEWAELLDEINADPPGTVLEIYRVTAM